MTRTSRANRIPLHSQAAAHLEAIRDAPGIADLSVAGARAAGLGYLALQRPSPAMARVVNTFIPGPTGDLAVRVLYPSMPSDRLPAVVLFHGSGWVIANIDVVDEPARVLARDTGFVVITVNYQKAPEHPFPIPLHDCLAALRWVVDNADRLGVDGGRIAVLGDSAGGNLAAAVTSIAVDDAIPVAAQALVYPALDHRRSSESYRLFAEGYGLDARDMAWFWERYLGDGAQCSQLWGADPRVSPILRADLTGMPPTFVATASHDVLRDEGEHYAVRLRDAGVDVQTKRYDGMIHGFWWMDAVLDTARTLQSDLADWLCRVLCAVTSSTQGPPRHPPVRADERESGT